MVATEQLGAAVAGALRERLSDIRAAATISDLIVGRPRLSGTRMQVLTLDLGSQACSIWEASHPRLPTTGDGLVDWTQVGRIRLNSIKGA